MKNLFHFINHKGCIDNLLVRNSLIYPNIQILTCTKCFQDVGYIYESDGIKYVSVFPQWDKYKHIIEERVI